MGLPLNYIQKTIKYYSKTFILIYDWPCKELFINYKMQLGGWGKHYARA